MNSMKDALTKALEHPIEQENRRKVAPSRSKRSPSLEGTAPMHEFVGGWLLTGIVGFSFLLAYRLLRR
jgi:hypothetical protein